jgi:hypothetical protein
MRQRIGQSRSDVWSKLLRRRKAVGTYFHPSRDPNPSCLSASGADATRSPKARRASKWGGRQASCPGRQELADTLPSDGDPSRAEVVDGVVDPFLAVDIDVEQLRERDLDSRDAFGQFRADERERSPCHTEPL